MIGLAGAALSEGLLIASEKDGSGSLTQPALPRLTRWRASGGKALRWRRETDGHSLAHSRRSVLDQLNVRLLPQLPLESLAVVLRVHEALPVLVVDGVVVHAVVIAGIARFLAELNVPHVALGGDDAMVVFPGAQQLVQILGAHLERILLEHVELVAAHLEHLGV